MISSRGVIEPLACIRLLPIVTYVIECICFKEISVVFLNLSILYIILLTFCIFSVYTGQIYFPIVHNLILWRIVLTAGFLAFGSTIFHTKFCDFCA